MSHPRRLPGLHSMSASTIIEIASGLLARPAAAAPRPILARASFVARWRTMARIGLRMAFHDKMKFAGGP